MAMNLATPAPKGPQNLYVSMACMISMVGNWVGQKDRWGTRVPSGWRQVREIVRFQHEDACHAALHRHPGLRGPGRARSLRAARADAAGAGSASPSSTTRSRCCTLRRTGARRRCASSSSTRRLIWQSSSSSAATPANVARVGRAALCLVCADPGRIDRRGLPQEPGRPV